MEIGRGTDENRKEEESTGGEKEKVKKTGKTQLDEDKLTRTRRKNREQGLFKKSLTNGCLDEMKKKDLDEVKKKDQGRRRGNTDCSCRVVLDMPTVAMHASAVHPTRLLLLQARSQPAGSSEGKYARMHSKAVCMHTNQLFSKKRKSVSSKCKSVSSSSLHRGMSI